MTQPLVLNFSHPLSSEQLSQLSRKLGMEFAERHIPIHVQSAEDMLAFCEATLAEVQLSASEWQSIPLLINPPGLSSLACLLLTAIHGRCGYFPSLIVVRPVPEAPLPTFYISDVVNLQALRERSRQTRTL